jgi:hypothetical protein
MISVAAIRMQQFGVQFYQASLTARDIDKLVRFEVLSYGEQAQGVRGSKKGPAVQTKVNWDLLERRIGANEKAYQRQIIRKKIDELVQYYEQCRQARDLPSIPGAVIISCDEDLAAAHDSVRALNDREDSPLYGEIKLLGVGKGRVAQAPLAQELKKLFAAEAFGAGRKGEAFREESRRFFVNYFKQIAVVFGAAWNGRKYSIKSATALRAFVRVAPDVIQRLDQEHAERTDFRAIGRVIAPWGRRIGNMRFETDAAWKRTGTTVDALAKELRLALQYPEGAAV